jgi:hypothetical protein
MGTELAEKVLANEEMPAAIRSSDWKEAKQAQQLTHIAFHIADKVRAHLLVCVWGGDGGQKCVCVCLSVGVSPYHQLDWIWYHKCGILFLENRSVLVFSALIGIGIWIAMCL